MVNFGPIEQRHLSFYENDKAGYMKTRKRNLDRFKSSSKDNCQKDDHHKYEDRVTLIQWPCLQHFYSGIFFFFFKDEVKNYSKHSTYFINEFYFVYSLKNLKNIYLNQLN